MLMVPASKILYLTVGQMEGRDIFAIGTNPDYYNPYYESFGPQAGSDAMMIVNGSLTPNTVVWAGVANQPLIVGDTYDFSFWARPLYSVSPATLASYLGVDAGGTLLATQTLTDGSWLQISGVFTATSSTGDFALVDNNTASNGNDFALDNFSVTAVPDGGMTIALLGTSLLGIALFRRKFATA